MIRLLQTECAATKRCAANLVARWTLFALLVQGLSFTPVQAEPPNAFTAANYIRDVKPLLARKCYACHGPLKQEGSLRLDTRGAMLQGGESGAAVVPGRTPQSRMWKRVTAEPGARMPPEGEPLDAAELDLLKRWIASNAPAPANEQPLRSPADHWSFQPLTPWPATSEDTHPIDVQVRSALARQGLQPSPRADARTIVRRMFFVMHGLPPTPAQADDWARRLKKAEQAGEESRKAVIQELIDFLCASPRYGERWAQHWLDLVRYADTHGFEVNTPRPNAWPYRDYVIKAFNHDKPYDQFVFEQLAGDTVGEDAATGFLVAAPVLLPGQIGKDEVSKRLARQDSLDEIVVGASATFLGLSMGCARCHDHKFDPISQTDYYAMQAFFAGVEYADRPLRSHRDETLIAEARQQVRERQAQLAPFQSIASSDSIEWIDDEDLDNVALLAKKNGHGANPAGKQRGYKDDVGGTGRGPNLSRGRYTWWPNKPGDDVFTWNPASTGWCDVWISWGVHGSGVHTRDARYVLDLDGDLSTRDDQTEIAKADQYYYAGQTEGPSEQKPRWSGFQHAGRHHLQPESKVVLRCGETGTGITADVLAIRSAAAEMPAAEMPVARGLIPRAPVSPLANQERFAPIEAKFVRFTSLATVDNNKHQPCIDELEIFATESPERNIALASLGVKATSSGNYSNSGKHQLKHINDGRYGNSHSWISNEYGKGWVQLELPEPAAINRVVWGRDREGKFPDRLAIDYRIEASNDGTHWTTIASSGDRAPPGTPFDATAAVLRRIQLDPSLQNLNAAASASEPRAERLQKIAAELEAWQAKLDQRNKPQLVYAGTFRKPDSIFRLNRGDPEQPLEPVVAATPQAIGGLAAVRRDESQMEAEGRAALAKWIANARNPLTARVITNRIWLHHFGAGLVDTPSDFGLRCSPPSHPQLLDGLANELIRSGWSLKHLHRLILTSETFQQSAKIDAQSLLQDNENRWLWRYRSRRVEGEVIRDSMLQVSGQLNEKRGGPGFNFFKTRGGLNGFPPVEQFTDNEKRRMIYAHKIRMERVPVFGAFDCPDAGQAAPVRTRSTTAIQALNLFNSPFVLAQADALEQRIVQQVDRTAADEPDPNKDDRVRRLVQLAFRESLGREPTGREVEQAIPLVSSHGVAALGRAIFNTNEFLFIP